MVHIPVTFIAPYGGIEMGIQAMWAEAIGFSAQPFRDQDHLDSIQIVLIPDRTRGEEEAGAASSGSGFNRSPLVSRRYFLLLTPAFCTNGQRDCSGDRNQRGGREGASQPTHAKEGHLTFLGVSENGYKHGHPDSELLNFGGMCLYQGEGSTLTSQWDWSFEVCNLGARFLT